MKVTKEFIESIGGSLYHRNAVEFSVLLDEDVAKESGYTIARVVVQFNETVSRDAENVMCDIFKQFVKRGIEIGEEITKREIRNTFGIT